MTPSSVLSWQWRARTPALEARAALAWGQAAGQLHARLGELSAEQQNRLSATANRDVLVVVGAVIDLPWVDGVAYAAESPETPSLWLPTCWQPTVPCDLLAQALGRRHGRHPVLLWPQPAGLVPLDRLQPVSSALLARIDAHWQGR